MLFRKILPILIIAMSSLTMTGAEYFHTHADGANHYDCPVCVLNSNVNISVEKPVTPSDSYFKLNSLFTISESCVSLKGLFLNENNHGRAPPQL
ncbi:MAG: hypothetical protein LWX07_03960 [Bacteroidetes bacterium]|nr:hypothetical protein [Bacteroidota bacterium]